MYLLCLFVYVFIRLIRMFGNIQGLSLNLFQPLTILVKLRRHKIFLPCIPNVETQLPSNQLQPMLPHSTALDTKSDLLRNDFKSGLPYRHRLNPSYS
jgi:hypothetical protein